VYFSIFVAALLLVNWFYAMSDILFSTIEKFQQTRGPWGKFLDAGTGSHSLKWIQTLETISWDAITADNQMKESIERDSDIKTRFRSEIDSILVGNWMDESFCAKLGKYDTILADYLIGAVDGFSPYMQDIILEKYVLNVTLFYDFG